MPQRFVDFKLGVSSTGVIVIDICANMCIAYAHLDLQWGEE